MHHWHTWHRAGGCNVDPSDDDARAEAPLLRPCVCVRREVMHAWASVQRRPWKRRMNSAACVSANRTTQKSGPV